MKILKALTMAIPLLISVVVFFVCIIITVHSYTLDPIRILDAKLDLGISIIGIAITVWVGLNIYNLLEKKELERIIEKISDIEKKSEELNQQHEHQIKQARIQSNCMHALFDVVKSEEDLTKEKGLLGGSEFSYIDYIEGFIIKFERYARENAKLDTPFNISIHELFHGYTGSLADLIQEGWCQAGSHLRPHDIVQVVKIIESVNLMVKDNLFVDTYEAAFSDDESGRQVYIDILCGIEDANDAQLGIISEHLKAQYQLITGKILEFDPEL